MPWRSKGRQPADSGGYRHSYQYRHEFGNILPITELKPRQKATIAFINGNRRVIQRLADLGLTPETTVHILQTAPFNGPIEVAVRGSKLAIGRDIAKNILVRMVET